MKPYKILQVDRDAEPEVIEAAYKRLAAKYHPDKDRAPSATARMQTINAAYEILRDPVRRRRYDRTRERDRKQRETRHAEHPPSKPEHAATPPPLSRRAAEQARSSWFQNALWLAALVAFVVYFPWGIAMLVAAWASVKLARRYPGAFATVLKVCVALVVGSGVYWWLMDQSEKRRANAEGANVRSLSVADTYREQIAAFTSSCTTSASDTAVRKFPFSDQNPAMATGYCRCLAEAIRREFDFSAITESSVFAYQQEFDRRFKAALPDTNAQSACWSQGQSRPVPVSKPKPMRVTKAKTMAPAATVPPDPNLFDPRSEPLN